MRNIVFMLLLLPLVASAEWVPYMSLQPFVDTSEEDFECSGSCAPYRDFKDTSDFNGGLSLGGFYTAMPVHLGATLDFEHGVGLTLRAHYPLVHRFSVGAGIGVRMRGSEGVAALGDQAEGHQELGAYAAVQAGYGPVFVRYAYLHTENGISHQAFQGFDARGNPIYGPQSSADLEHRMSVLQLGVQFFF